MSTELAVQTKTDLVIAPEQTGFTDSQLAALRQLGVENAPAGDVAVFFHQAKRTGLDPFAKQIYMIGRKTKVGNGYQMRYTIQIGIDGYRLNARRSAESNNDRLATEGPMWRGETGNWDDVWLNNTAPPAAAKFTVIRNGEAFTGIAMYHEYVQTYYDTDTKTQVPNSMWKKMPANQLAKCAEAAAWRRAYPDDFSGLVFEDAVHVIDESGEPVGRPAQRGRGVAGLRDRAAEQDAEVVDESSMSDEARRKWLNRMFALLGEADCSERSDQLVVIAATAGLPVGELEHRDALSESELRAVVNTMNVWSKAGELGDKVRDILDQAAEQQGGEQQTLDTTDGGRP